MAKARKTIDVVGQQIGTLYATALYDAAVAQANVDDVLTELDSLVSDVLDRFPEFEAVLSSLRIHEDEKRAIIDRTVALQASPLLTNFLKVLAERDRLGYLREVAAELRTIHDERQGRVQVEVTTATPMDATMIAQLTEDIRRESQREPVLATTVDPDLIGGIQLRFGDTVYDGSVASELSRMRTVIRQQNDAEIDIHPEKYQQDGTS
jgi:F-type H+-transporting ATPase subunit delta